MTDEGHVCHAQVGNADQLPMNLPIIDVVRLEIVVNYTYIETPKQYC